MKEINVAKEIFKEKKSNYVFSHYTSCEALKSIVTNSSLRFTNCMFLNDIEEYNYIFDFIKSSFSDKDDDIYKFIYDITKSLYDEDFDADMGEVVDNNSDYYLGPKDDGMPRRKAKKGEYYVLSGSIVEDSLPMWVYYSHAGDYLGYSIKLDVRNIINEVRKNAGEVLYGRVIYDNEKKTSIIRNKAEELFRKYDLPNIENDAIDSLQEEYYEFIQNIRLFFKRDGFKNEQEFRIVMLVDRGELDSSGYYISKGIIKPYIELKFSDGVPICGIMMSPSIEEKLGAAGLKVMLNDQNRVNYSGIDIRKSSLRLRY